MTNIAIAKTKNSIFDGVNNYWDLYRSLDFCLLTDE